MRENGLCLKKLMVLDGPNVYSHESVIRAVVDISSWGTEDSRMWPHLVHRLLRCLPGLEEHYCSRGRRGGFAERLREGTLVGHVLEHVALELLALSGQDVRFGKTRAVDKTRHIYDVVIGFECREAAVLALKEGCLFLNRLRELSRLEEVAGLEGVGGLEGVTGLAGVPACLEQESGYYRDADAMDVRRMAARIVECTERCAPGPSTLHVLECCRRMNVPVRLYQRSLMRLGYGCRGRWMRASLSETDSCIGVELAQDKELTRRILRGAGLPVPLGGVVRSELEARDFLRALGRSVVIKPCTGNQGRNVFVGLCSERQVAGAFRLAAGSGTAGLGTAGLGTAGLEAAGQENHDAGDACAGGVVAEEFVEGRHYRLLVMGGELAAAACREPAKVMGDGYSTLARLIEVCNEDPRRGSGHGRMLSKIRLSQAELFDLACRGWSPESVPEKGRVVYVCSGANLSTGGTAYDVTSLAHEGYCRMASDAARCLGLSVAGVDMVMPDISCFEADKVKILEVNAAPGLRMHLPGELGQRLVKLLFPEGKARIPLVAVTGSNGKSSVARMVAYGLACGGNVVGLACSDGVVIGGEKMLAGDRTGPESARCVLSHPRVDAAVLETARGGILRGGLGYDWADVAVVTNVTGDHRGEFGVESLEDLLRVKGLVAERVLESGGVVLNADDEGARSLAEYAGAPVIYFSRQQDNRWMRRHLSVGGKGILLLNHHIVLAEGNNVRYLCSIRDVALGRAEVSAERGAAPEGERSDEGGYPWKLVVKDVQGNGVGEAVREQITRLLRTEKGEKLAEEDSERLAAANGEGSCVRERTVGHVWQQTHVWEQTAMAYPHEQAAAVGQRRKQGAAEAQNSRERETDVCLPEGSNYREEGLSGAVDIRNVDVRDVTAEPVPGFMLENILASVGAAWALGQPYSAMRRMVMEFSWAHNPGRWEWHWVDLKVQGVTRPLPVIVDYAHNPAALRAVAEALDVKGWARSGAAPVATPEQMAQGKTEIIGCIGMPGNRRDEDIVEFGRVAGEFFSCVYIKEDKKLRGRKPGETAELIRQGVESSGNQNVHVILQETEAVKAALNEARVRAEERQDRDQAGEEGYEAGNDIVFVSYENLAGVRECLRE